MENNFSNLLFVLLSKAKSIALTTHLNSDGDGMVALFALQEILWQKGLDSTIISDGEDLARYDFLMHKAKVLPFEESMQYDATIVVDCNSYDRLGQRRALVDRADNVAIIDHHILEHNPIEGDLLHIDYRQVSVGAMVWQLFEDEIKSYEPDLRNFIARCTYVSILNDTNNFVNANSKKDVFELAAKLCDEGIEPHVLNREFFHNYSANEILYNGRTLSTLTMELDGRVLFLYSDYALAQSLNYDPENKMSVVRHVQGVAEAEGVIYCQEKSPDVWKVSLRSLILNVQEIAARFGGGGHRRASGLTIEGSLAKVKETLLREFEKALEEA